MSSANVTLLVVEAFVTLCWGWWHWRCSDRPALTVVSQWGSLAASCTGGCWSPEVPVCLPDAVEWNTELKSRNSPGAVWLVGKLEGDKRGRESGGHVLLQQPIRALHHNRSEWDGPVVTEWCDLRFLWHWDEGGSYETWWDFDLIQWGL